MSDSTASLTRKISSAGDLQSVVRTMKALAASSIGQYDKSVRALGDYYRTVELGLGRVLSGKRASTAGRKTERTNRHRRDWRGRVRIRSGIGGTI